MTDQTQNVPLDVVDSPPKFCRDCRHLLLDNGWEYAKCQKSSLTVINLVSGLTTYGYCSVERGRMDDEDCGPDGKLWEAK